MDLCLSLCSHSFSFTPAHTRARTAAIKYNVTGFFFPFCFCLFVLQSSLQLYVYLTPLRVLLYYAFLVLSDVSKFLVFLKFVCLTLSPVYICCKLTHVSRFHIICFLLPVFVTFISCLCTYIYISALKLLILPILYFHFPCFVQNFSLYTNTLSFA